MQVIVVTVTLEETETEGRTLAPGRSMMFSADTAALDGSSSRIDPP
jgi:hypothetical protein